MVGSVLFLCIFIMNCAVYYLIDSYFLYSAELHTHVYKSNHYTAEKKLAVKKISNRGYMRC